MANRVFRFEEAGRGPEESLTVSIPEVLLRRLPLAAAEPGSFSLSGLVLCQVLDPRYGMYVWPCAVVLAQYLWSRREQLRGRTVLEVRRRPNPNPLSRPV